MTNEELIETLNIFQKERVENLPDKSKKIFYAIMKIADERDKYKEILDKIKEYRKWLDKNTVIYNSGECVKLNGTYWEVEGIKIILDKILEEIK